MKIRDPRATRRYVLEEHKELPEEERPWFDIQQSLTARQFESVQSASKSRVYQEGSEVSVGLVQAALFLHAAIEGLKDWGNLQNPDGSELRFSREAIENRLDYNWVVEIGQAIMKDEEVSADTAKN